MKAEKILKVDLHTLPYQVHTFQYTKHWNSMRMDSCRPRMESQVLHKLTFDPDMCTLHIPLEAVVHLTFIHTTELSSGVA